MDKITYTLSYDTKQNHRARVFLCFLLIFCMVGSCMAKPVESHASVTLSGLAVGGAVALTLGALLVGSGVILNSDNTVPLVNALYFGMDDAQKEMIASFNTGQAIGDLFDAVSGFFVTHLNTGNLFFSNDVNESLVFPSMYVLSPGTVRCDEFYLYPPYSTDVFNILGCEVSYVNNYPGSFSVKFLDGTILEAGHSSGAIEKFNPFSTFMYSQSDNSYKVGYHYDLTTGNDNYSYSLKFTPDSAYFPSNLFWYLEYIRTGTMSESASISVTTPIPEYLPSSDDVAKALTTTTPLHVPQTWEQLWDSMPTDVRTGTFSGGEVVNPDLPIEGSTSGTITGTGTGTGVFGDTGSWIWDIPILGNILALLSQIWSIIQNLFTSIVGSIVSALQNFFLPTPEQFTGFVEDLHETVDSSGFPTINQALDFGADRRPDNISLSVFGQTVDIVPFDYVEQALEQFFRPIIRGLIWFLLAFYEVNQFSMLFTGRRMFDLASAFGNKREEESKERGLVKL